MLVRGVMSETGKEEAMRERWKKIRTGTLTIAFIIIGILEYGALMKYFDLPQVMLIVPLIGAASYIFLKKSCLTVFGCTALCSALYQLVAGDANAIAADECRKYCHNTFSVFDCPAYSGSNRYRWGRFDLPVAKPR